MSGRFRADRTEGVTAAGNVFEGVRFLLARRPLGVLGVWAFLANFAGGITFSVLVLYAVTPGPLGLGKAGYGFLIAALGVGGLLGSLVAGWVADRLGVTNLLATATVGMAVDSAALALTTDVRLVAPALVLGAAAAAMFSVMATTTLQPEAFPS